jgi:tRNA threonylcarbamoyladenosine modification (KEOPS) complex  Pcc1 subunit
MKASLEFDSENPHDLKDAVGLSLESSEKVNYSYTTEKGSFKVDIETDRLGSLRGSTDAVFRLVSLSERLR